MDVYLGAVFDIINWNTVSKRYTSAKEELLEEA